MLALKKLTGASSDRIGRAVGVLAGGTVIGHGISAIAMPILTRTYTPTDFAVYAAFSAALGVIAVAVCLRYELVVPIPESDTDALNAVAVCIFSAAVVSMIVTVGVYAARPIIVQKVGNGALLLAHLWILPLSTFIAGVFATLQAWLVRRRQFCTIAGVRIAQSTAAATGQIGAGIAWQGPVGLILGPALNCLAGSVISFLRIWKQDRILLSEINWKQAKGIARQYSKFPIYSTWESLANSGGIHLPIVLIAALGAADDAGYLALAMYVVHAPLALIGNATGQVYLSHAADEHRLGQLGTFTEATIARLARIGIGPLVFLAIASPSIFGLVFGTGWSRAGSIVSWLVPWFALQLLATPVSSALHIASRHRAAFGVQLLGLILRTGSVVAVHYIGAPYLIEAYAASGLLFYLFHVLVIFHYTDSRPGAIFRVVRVSIYPALAWGVAGAFVYLAGATVSEYIQI